MSSAPEAPSQPHSADYFGEQRDFWWNDDFVALLARRWRLAEVHAGLDLGAGLGHWGRLLLPHLAPDATLIGVEREPAWVKGAGERAAALGLSARLRYVEGVVQALPFPDASFDMVTCQTLLIHVADPAGVLREMIRVLRPGGLLAVAEPNNLANAMALSSSMFDADVERIVDLVRWDLHIQRGKAKLGEGHNSIGEQLPGLFSAEGLVDIAVCQSDKASAMFPPYAGREQAVRRAEVIDWAERGLFGYDRPTARRYFFANGEGEAEFERLWALNAAAWSALAAGYRAGTEHGAGGGFQYLVSGRRPS